MGQPPNSEAKGARRVGNLPAVGARAHPCGVGDEVPVRERGGGDEGPAAGRHGEADCGVQELVLSDTLLTQAARRPLPWNGRSDRQGRLLFPEMKSNRLVET